MQGGGKNKGKMRTGMLLTLLLGSSLLCYGQMGPFIPIQLDKQYSGWAGGVSITNGTATVVCYELQHTCVRVVGGVQGGNPTATVYGQQQQVLATFEFTSGSWASDPTKGQSEFRFSGVR